MTEPDRRNTRQRRAVEATLRQTSDFVSAQELHAKMRSGGDSVGLATVYRTLGLMADTGLVDMIRAEDGEARYRLCESDEHHHHLVCRDCGRTVEVEEPAAEQWAAEMARSHGFTNVSHTLEIFGTCDACA
ncbi:Fur family transcriptional regulator [Mobilicoccus caccae]|uniref:Transcriptional repressor n=1 Tax=Mobilicoccus caccae TaxID=1859295 RepID=A0ABQ6ITM2_9MICO|nr:transcriptional repressor [Mobilicoccus caccae]GMA40064.1 transcriptional repressor [Mobilicoccus caccae]